MYSTPRFRRLASTASLQGPRHAGQATAAAGWWAEPGVQRLGGMPAAGVRPCFLRAMHGSPPRARLTGSARASRRSQTGPPPPCRCPTWWPAPGARAARPTRAPPRLRRVPPRGQGGQCRLGGGEARGGAVRRQGSSPHATGARQKGGPSSCSLLSAVSPTLYSSAVSKKVQPAWGRGRTVHSHRFRGRRSPCCACWLQTARLPARHANTRLQARRLEASAPWLIASTIVRIRPSLPSGAAP